MGGAGSSDTRGSLGSTMVSEGMEVELDRLIISLCCMQAVMKKVTTVQEYNNRFEGMVHQGANIGVGPFYWICPLNHTQTEGRSVQQMQKDPSLSWDGSPYLGMLDVSP